MSCAHHPDRAATAYCQSCGKALCPQCVRHAEGFLLCEPCLLLRYPAALGASAAMPGIPATDWSSVPVAGRTPYASAGYASAAYASAGYASAGYVPGAPGYVPPPLSGAAANPVLAGGIGWIPGVGAMYNGQFIKALIDVVVFVLLIGVTRHFGPAGILIAAWVVYLTFDAVQTAAARRDGRPLPDPFGILEWSRRVGPQAAYHPAYAPIYGAAPAYTPVAPYATPMPEPVPGPVPGPAIDQAIHQAIQDQAIQDPGIHDPATGPASPDPRRPADSSGPYQPAPYQPAPYQPVAPAAPFAPVRGMVPVAARRGEPVGAIVLIAVGLLLLMSTLGVWSVDWIARGWPVLILGLGLWLLLRRVKEGSPSPMPSPISVPTPQSQSPSGPSLNAEPGTQREMPPGTQPGTSRGSRRNPLSIFGEPGPGETGESATGTHDGEER